MNPMSLGAREMTNCTIETDEVGKRYSVFYVVGCVASAFSGILAYGVSI